MFSVSHKGKLKKTKDFLDLATSQAYLGMLDGYGRKGVKALSAATPIDEGETANSWTYKIVRSSTQISIIWMNSKMAGRSPVAILLQYGHATRNGGYVEGRDYINPAARPIFDDLAKEMWKQLCG